MSSENRLRRGLVLLAPLMLLPGSAAARRPRLVLVVATEMADSYHGAWAEMVYREALRRLGYELEVRAYPARRASMMSGSGQVDGELSRAARYGKRHPGMVRVEPSHFSIDFAAYGREAVRLRPGWEGLRNTGYRVDYRSGMAAAELELPAVVPPDHLSTSSRAEYGLAKLAQGRVDVFIDLASAVEPMLRRAALARAGIRQVALMERAEMHAYLNERHRALAGQLSAVLAQLKREGYLERCHQAALRQAAAR